VPLPSAAAARLGAELPQHRRPQRSLDLEKRRLAGGRAPSAAGAPVAAAAPPCRVAPLRSEPGVGPLALGADLGKNEKRERGKGI